MLVKFTESNGKEIWVNPVHVKGLRPKGKATVIFIGLNPNWGQISVKVSMPLDDVAHTLNAAMPDLMASFVEEDSTQNPAVLAG